MSSGGKSGGSASQSYDYYGTILIRLCEGPADAIDMIIADNKTIWTGPLLRTGIGPDTIAVASWGTFDVYWGMPGQPVSSVLSAYESHPAYAGQCYIVYKGLLGRERTTCPNFEFILRRRANQSIVTGAPALLDANNQSNMVAFAAELITAATGLGWATSRLDAASWQAVANSLDTADLCPGAAALERLNAGWR